MTSLSESQFSELYSAYAAGALDPGFALLVEAQSVLRADVRQSVATCEAAAGILLESTDAAPLQDGALADVMARLDLAEPEAPRTQAKADPAIDALPEPVRRAVEPALMNRRWQPTAPGIQRLSLDVSREVEVELYRISPGAAVPRHTHEATEFTLVLAGGFTDASGSYGPGDLAMKGPDDTHRPVGDAGEVCYALAVRDGGLRFKGVLGLIQRTLGA